MYKSIKHDMQGISLSRHLSLSLLHLNYHLLDYEANPPLDFLLSCADAEPEPSPPHSLVFRRQLVGGGGGAIIPPFPCTESPYELIFETEAELDIPPFGPPPAPEPI